MIKKYLVPIIISIILSCNSSTGDTSGNGGTGGSKTETAAATLKKSWDLVISKNNAKALETAKDLVSHPDLQSDTKLKSKVYELLGWLYCLNANGLKTDAKYKTSLSYFEKSTKENLNNADAYAGTALVGHLIDEYQKSYDACLKVMSLAGKSYKHSYQLKNVSYNYVLINAAWSSYMMKKFDDTRKLLKELDTQTDFSAVNNEDLVSHLRRIGKPETLGGPNTVKLLKIDTTAGRIKLIWSKYPGADFKQYDLYGAESAGATKKLKSFSNVKDTVYLSEKLSPGKTYYYRVKVINTENKESSFSNELSIRIKSASGKYDGKVVLISDADYKKEVLDEKDRYVLVDFWAIWCGPCVMMDPWVKEVADKYRAKLKVRKIDTDKHSVVFKQLGFQYLPTWLIYKDGKVIFKAEGAPQDQATFIQTIDQYVK